MSIRLSIIIPVWNAGKTIERVVRSVLFQTVRDFELIVVNDGSQDQTLNILRNFRDERLIIIDNHENVGTYISQNIGMHYSKGKYIAFVGADDIISPFRFEKILEHFDSNPEILYIETRYLRFHESSKKIWFREWTKGVGCSIFHRKVLEEIGYFLPVLAEGDSEYRHRIKQYYSELKMSFLDDFTYWASLDDNNLTVKFQKGGPERVQFKEYYQSKMHLGAEDRVLFPYSQERIKELKNFAICSKNITYHPNMVTFLEPFKSANLAVEQLSSVALELIRLNEESLSHYFGLLTQTKNNLNKVKSEIATFGKRIDDQLEKVLDNAKD